MKAPTFLKEFDAKAEMLGFKFSGFSGKNHPIYYNADVDVTVIAPLTPSDYRSQANSLANMERLSGRKLPRGHSGRHSFKPVRQKLETRLSDTEKSALERVNKLIAEAELLRSQWSDLINGAVDRSAAAQARDLLASYEEIRSELAAFHRTIPPLSAA